MDYFFNLVYACIPSLRALVTISSNLSFHPTSLVITWSVCRRLQYIRTSLPPPCSTASFTSVWSKYLRSFLFYVTYAYLYLSLRPSASISRYLIQHHFVSLSVDLRPSASISRLRSCGCSCDFPPHCIRRRFTFDVATSAHIPLST